MSESLQSASALAIKNEGNRLPLGAIHCTRNFHAEVARLRWPRKTALHWAIAAGVKERMAKYWLAGKHEVSADGKLAIIRELD